MNCSGNEKKKRIAASIIALMLLVFFLFFSFFIAVEADHDCEGEDCPICVCIQQCEEALHQMGNGIAFQAAIIIPAFFLLLTILISFFSVVSNTLTCVYLFTKRLLLIVIP